MAVLRIPKATGFPHGGGERRPGWWWHCYGCLRADCPRCGRREILYWIAPGQVRADGTLSDHGVVTCPDCGLSGEPLLEGDAAACCVPNAGLAAAIRGGNGR